MVLSLRDRYVVLTGDLKSSRKSKDRAKIQEKLKNSLSVINEEFEEAIVAKFVVVGGDSFQGMVLSPQYIPDIYYLFFEKIEHQFYLGIGIGNISTVLSKNVGEMDGEAFHRASAALEQAKKENVWIRFKSGWEADSIFSSLLNFAADAMWGWTKRQREIVMHYKKAKSEKSSVTMQEIADDMGIKKQTVSKILKRSKYKMIEEAKKSFVDFVSQKWLIEECKP
ncbi:MAG: SatD family protein [Candidatus Methanofastidiosia archaeon]